MHRASTMSIGPRCAFVSIAPFVEVHNTCQIISLSDIPGRTFASASGQDVESMQKYSAMRAYSPELVLPDDEVVPVYNINTCFDVRERRAADGRRQASLPADEGNAGLR